MSIIVAPLSPSISIATPLSLIRQHQCDLPALLILLLCLVHRRWARRVDDIGEFDLASAVHRIRIRIRIVPFPLHDTLLLLAQIPQCASASPSSTLPPSLFAAHSHSHSHPRANGVRQGPYLRKQDDVQRDAGSEEAEKKSQRVRRPSPRVGLGARGGASVVDSEQDWKPSTSRVAVEIEKKAPSPHAARRVLRFDDSSISGRRSPGPRKARPWCRYTPNGRDRIAPRSSASLPSPPPLSAPPLLRRHLSADVPRTRCDEKACTGAPGRPPIIHRMWSVLHASWVELRPIVLSLSVCRPTPSLSAPPFLLRALDA
ncbi:hypothetical protein B0H12DRAFT_1235437 [Mycena haematopus]|nr:hypothetical protein B0H12DRAFT_1235437 [Mycena haematopus]